MNNQHFNELSQTQRNFGDYMQFNKCTFLFSKFEILYLCKQFLKSWGVTLVYDRHLIKLYSQTQNR